MVLSGSLQLLSASLQFLSCLVPSSLPSVLITLYLSCPSPLTTKFHILLPPFQYLCLRALREEMPVEIGMEVRDSRWTCGGQ